MSGAYSFPEGVESSPNDDDRRLYIKWNQILYDQNGNVGSTPYPEGVEPLASDDEHRSLTKITAIYAAL